ncbi:MAG: hypothetical protein ACRC8M_05390 [Cetobacterium sp.]|uniref:hypothetical protein n=1 Tax=Cetobacterium sp. TaxID=2071632 RepID=UPI003F31F51D
MIIAYEKLTNSYRNIVKENLFHIGEGLILDRENNVLHRFNNINDITLDTLKTLNKLKEEIVIVYPCNLRDRKTTLDVCVESYIIRHYNLETIFDAIHGCQCTKRNIKLLWNVDLRHCNVFF